MNVHSAYFCAEKYYKGGGKYGRNKNLILRFFHYVL